LSSSAEPGVEAAADAKYHAAEGTSTRRLALADAANGSDAQALTGSRGGLPPVCVWGK
jgi:hypothetical protein